MLTAQHLLLLCTFSVSVVFSDTLKSKVAVVTGANKGIGYEIVKGLCEKYDGHVYLTSRDEDRGRKAVEKLNKLGLNPYYHQLDVVDPTSIKKFRDYINETEGGIDILINNAGITLHRSDSNPIETQIENLIKINYFGVLQVSSGLFPLLRHNARVINLSSALGKLSHVTSSELRSKLTSSTTTISELNDLINNYTNLAKQRKETQVGWPANKVYIVSKIAVSALTFIQQREVDAEFEKRNISVNCVHPGYVDTDLTEHTGIISPKEGARAPLYLALENHNLRGKFLWNDLTVFDWYNN